MTCAIERVGTKSPARWARRATWPTSAATAAAGASDAAAVASTTANGAVVPSPSSFASIARS